jgi:hypothetical protein
MAPSPLLNQITNRNFLSGTGFKFVLSKSKKVDFFCSEANIPGINLGVAIQPTYLKDIPIPGDKLTYDDLSLKFIVDENMENYSIIHNWLRGFGYPEDVYEYQELLNEDEVNPGKQTAYSGQSDGELIIYNSNLNPVSKVIFKGLFPTSLSAISFSSQTNDAKYVIAEVSFKYTIYEIIPVKQPTLDSIVYEKPTIEFTASSLLLDEGDSSILNWVVKNAYKAVITADYGENIGEVDLTGSREVTPDSAITYTITATGRGGVVRKSLIISVLPSSASRTCIAVIDETYGSWYGDSYYTGPTPNPDAAWSTFISNWPNRKFYLLEPRRSQFTPGVFTNIRLPIDFAESTDPESVAV